MEYTSEIYLVKKHVCKEEWLELIKVISDYNGILRKWQIYITDDNNQIRYFVRTKRRLPTTINNLSNFLLKNTKEINIPKSKLGYIYLPKIGSNIIDILNHCEIKNKGNLKFLEISFLKIFEDKILNKTKIILEKNGTIKPYQVLLALPQNILSVNFDGNKRYFYKSPPSYLDIKKILPLLNNDSTSSILKLDTFPYLQGNFYLNQNNYNFASHSIILGASGSGKSKFLSLLINNIYNNKLKDKYKIVVIDPHASLENDIGGLGKVIDFKNEYNSIDLFINDSSDIISSTELLIDLLKSLIADNYNSKLERVLRHSIHLLLTSKKFNFSNLRKLLLDIDYRNSIIQKLKFNLPSSVIDFFLSDFNDLKTKSYSEAISPIIAFIDEMEILPIFNDQNTINSLKKTIEDNFLTIFSLNRTSLGDKITKTVAGLIMGQLLTLVQNHVINQHVIFIIDEVAIVENPILSRFLSEARKYNLSLYLAGQYFNQISDNLKNAIFSNVINYYIFRVSKLDANVLVDNFNMNIPLNNTNEQKIKLLTELNNRECIVRIASNGVILPAFKASTLNFKSIPKIDGLNIELVEKERNTDVKNDFKVNSNINLKDILMSISSNEEE